MMKSIAIMAFAFLAGCAVAPIVEAEKPFDGKIRVRISPKLGAWHEEMLESVSRWNKLLAPQVELVPSVSDEADGKAFHDYTIDIVPAPPNVFPPDAKTVAVTDMRRGKDGLPGSAPDKPRCAVIFVFRDGVDLKTRLWTMLHELGHALGLDHDTDKTHLAIMWPFASEPIKLGCEDWRRLCDIWGCQPGCEGQTWL